MEISAFGIVDYCIFLSVLIISFVIGICTAFKGNKSTEEYLLGNRSFKVVPVSLSLLTSFVSGINLLGLTSEVYGHGSQLFLFAIGAAVGILVGSVVTLPVLFNLKLTSINEYVWLRFQSRPLYLFISATVLFQAIVYMGVCVYAPSLALAAVTPLDYKTYIFLMGGVCTVYSTIGGIRAVVWTDFFQFFIMMGGFLMIIGAAVYQMGFEDIIKVANEGGRIEFFNLNPSVYERHNLYNTFMMGMFMYGELFGIAQIVLQRVCAVPTLSDARKVLAINAVGMIGIHAIILFGALAVYASYAGCDPLMQGNIKKKEEILSYFVVDKLSFFPGLAGIFVATLIATTLSTFSSVVNAQAAIVWNDYLSKKKFFADVKPRTAVLINKTLTCIIGLAFIGMAFLASKTASLIQLVFTVGGIAFGSMYGVYILGMCFPSSNSKGAWAGFLSSSAVLIWIYCGAIFCLDPPKLLPLSTELCNNSAINNLTLYDSNSTSIVSVYHVNETNLETENVTEPTESFPLEYLYGISYTFYPVIGPFLCIFVGIIVSYLTGPTNLKDIRPDLLIPSLRLKSSS